ncbi:hypothetical protein H4R99_003243 [Coemansia sp. RSA 1722]|nr:hypothetical protein IWW45_003030 [Coemansia sp. RSA 485]KAJ2600696.1 hypothetical protein H4R99_003243 [Coemansia sp. RSA 1722]
MAGEAGSESKGFSLFTAINGLLERARMSAERETQKLFSSPQPKPRKKQTFSSAKIQRTRPSSPVSVTDEQQSVRIGDLGRPTSHHQMLGKLRTATPRGRRGPSLGFQQQTGLERPESVVSERAQLADTVNLMAIQEESVGEREDDMAVFRIHTPRAEESVKMKRKLSEQNHVEFELESVGAKRTRSDVAQSPSARSLRSELERAEAQAQAQAQAQAEAPKESQTSMPPPPAPLLQRPASTLHSAAKQTRGHTPSRASQQAWRLQTRSNSVSNGTSVLPVPMSSFAPLQYSETNTTNTSVVERTRLEKVERELHRLKKIIASLLPEELNDDDLRSVYGDLEQPRLNSEDIVARLMKTRLGPHISAYTDRASMGGFRIPNTLGLPPSPISASPTQNGEHVSNVMAAPPPPPPKLPPMPEPSKLTAANLPVSPLIAAGAGFASDANRGYNSGSRRLRAGIAERPQSIASLRRKTSVDDDSSSTVSVGGGRVGGSAKRPRSSPEKQDKPVKKASQPPPPHKDPGVMTKLLQEMKHHKLRSVKKPKDMGGSSNAS